ncbi:MAG: cation-efflux pump, partial [Clostridiaceae bacterium]|nr:cation-efflux pump [Clostridiaceae bacterium]
ASEETVTAGMEAGAALEETGVCRVDEIRTRMFGSKVYVDIEIAADSRLELGMAHQIAENVHDAIENTFPKVKHCMVHVNPLETSER